LVLQVSGSPGPDSTIRATPDASESSKWEILFATNAPSIPFLWMDPDRNV